MDSQRLIKQEIIEHNLQMKAIIQVSVLNEKIKILKKLKICKLNLINFIRNTKE